MHTSARPKLLLLSGHGRFRLRPLFLSYGPYLRERVSLKLGLSRFACFLDGGRSKDCRKDGNSTYHTLQGVLLVLFSFGCFVFLLEGYHHVPGA